MKAALKKPFRHLRLLIPSRGSPLVPAQHPDGPIVQPGTVSSDSNNIPTQTQDTGSLPVETQDAGPDLTMERAAADPISLEPCSDNPSATNTQKRSLDISHFMERVDPDLMEKFGRFRILVIGRADASKTAILQRICNATEIPEIYNDHGRKVDFDVRGSRERGEHDINHEMVFESNQKFVFHDSEGFESGCVQHHLSWMP